MIEKKLLWTSKLSTCPLHMAVGTNCFNMKNMKEIIILKCFSRVIFLLRLGTENGHFYGMTLIEHYANLPITSYRLTNMIYI